MEKKKIFIAAAFIIYTHAAFSQSDTVRSVNLSEVNVVASRVEKNNSETPRSVTVITSEQILQSGFNSLSEVLSEAGGIYITGTGQNPGTNESIFMRGANSNQTVILVDGIRISDASTVNNTADLSEISLNDVDRIEIIRGSHSTMYGSGAVGGVISIQTKHGYKKGLNANASVTAGTFGKNTFDRRIDGMLGYTLKNGFYVNAGAEKILVDGIDATLHDETVSNSYNFNENDDWDRFSYHGDAGYHGDRLKVDVDYKVTDMKTDLDDGAYNDDDNYTMDFKRNSFGGNVSWKLNSFINTQISGGYTETSRHSVNDSSLKDENGNYDGINTESNYSGYTTNIDWQATAAFKFADFLAGISGTQEDMEQTDYLYLNSIYGISESKTKLDTIEPATTSSAYVHATFHGAALSGLRKPWNAFKYYDFSVGVRMTNHSVTGPQLPFDVALNIRPDENSAFYLSWSTGYNNPSLYQLYAPEMYLPYDGNPGTGLTRGNKDLEVENNESFEGGFRQNVSDKFSYSISYFHSVTENLIEYVFLWDHNVGMDTLGKDPARDDFRGDRYINLGTQTSNGLEVSIRSAFTKTLALEANASLVSGEIKYKPDEIIEAQTGGEQVQLYSNGAFLNKEAKTSTLVRRPSEANLKLIWSVTKKVMLIPSLRYVTSRNDIYYDGMLGPYGALAFKPVDAYTLVNLALNVNAAKHISLNIRSENLLNEKYEEIHGFATLGRSIYATVKFIL
jgi:vitamin B12 transporter